MGTAEKGAVAALFHYGQKDYTLGLAVVWQLFRVTWRLAKKPFVIGGLALLAGYVWAALKRVKRPVSPELMRFHRAEQMMKLKNIFRAVLRPEKSGQLPRGERPGQNLNRMTPAPSNRSPKKFPSR